MTDSPEVIPEVGTESANQRRQSFGAWARSYNEFRPQYPAAMYEKIIALTGKPAAEVSALDIGAGTGQVSQGLLSYGCQVQAVEPDDRMREVLSENVDIPTFAASAEELPLPDASVDLVVGGAMWHWVDQSRAVPEIARVLRPGGVLAIAWNLRDDREPWVLAMEEIVSMPDGYRWFHSAEAPSLGPLFSSPELVEIEHVQASDPARLVGLVSTFSHVGLSESRDSYLAGIQQMTQEHPDLAGRSSFEIPFICKLFTAIRAR